MTEGKGCTRCGEWKVATAFSRTSRSKTGLHSHCKACRTERNAAVHRTNNGGDATYIWPRSLEERKADFALREWRMAAPVAGVFAPSLGRVAA